MRVPGFRAILIILPVVHEPARATAATAGFLTIAKGTPATSPRGFKSQAAVSGVLQIRGRGLAAPPVGLDVEGQLLTLDEAAHSGSLHRGNVDEDVRAAAFLLYEAKPSLRIEKLDSTCSHIGLLRNAPRRLLAAQTRVRVRKISNRCNIGMLSSLCKSARPPSLFPIFSIAFPAYSCRCFMSFSRHQSLELVVCDDLSIVARFV